MLPKFPLLMSVSEISAGQHKVGQPERVNEFILSTVWLAQLVEHGHSTAGSRVRFLLSACRMAMVYKSNRLFFLWTVIHIFVSSINTDRAFLLKMEHTNSASR